jgi:1-acyl-sn-glycerol-3-phosphate acyltransferase
MKSGPMLLDSLLHLIRWPLSLAHVTFFFGILSSFHFFFLLTYPLFGKRVFNFPLALMNRFLIANIRLSGVPVHIDRSTSIPHSGPVIVVANHQSMYDIPVIMWELRHLNPRFISKRELAKGAPSISFALRRGDHLLIDRRDPARAIPAIREWARRMNSERQTVGLFAEGTRSRDGTLKPFKLSGFKVLREEMPTAVVVPVAIDGLWRVVRHKLLPIPLPCKVHITFFDPISVNDNTSSEQILAECESKITAALDHKQ